MIEQAIRNRVVRRASGGLHTFMPVEADPADWAEQQQPVPLPDDEYPHVGGDRRALGSAFIGNDIGW